MKKKIIIIFLIFMLTITLVACNKDNNVIEYLESSELNILSYASNAEFTKAKAINLGDIDNIKYIDYNNNLLTIENNNRAYIVDFDGKRVLGDENFDSIEKQFNKYVIKSGDTYIVYDGKNKTEYDAKVCIMYDGLILKYDTNGYKNMVLDSAGNTLYYIYDNKKTGEAVNYGKYLIYENHELMLFQVFDLAGNEIYNVNYVTQNVISIIYLGMEKLMLTTFDVVDGKTVYMDTVYDLTTKETSVTKRDSMTICINEATLNDFKFNIKQGYNLFITSEGNYIANGDQSIKKTIKTANTTLKMVDGYAVGLDDGDIVVYDNMANEIYRHALNAVSANLNDGIIVYSVIDSVSSLQRYGAIKVDGTKICDAIYDNMGTFVSGKAKVVLTENGIKNNYILDIDGSKAKIDANSANGDYGFYYVISDNKTTYYNYKNVKLYESDNSPLNIVNGFNNQSYMVERNNKNETTIVFFS